MKKRITKNDDAPKGNTLPEPFPASPSRPPKYTLWFTKKGDTKAIINFAATYSAKRFVDEVVQKTSYKWKDDYTIVLSTGLEIQCEPNLDKIIEYVYPELEGDWKLPTPYDRIAQMIRTGNYEKIDSVLPSSQVHDVKEDGGFKSGRVAMKGTNQQQVTKKSVSKGDVPKGWLTLADVCTAAKVDPREARQQLRKHWKKHDAGWVFDPKDKAKVIAVVKGSAT